MNCEVDTITMAGLKEKEKAVTTIARFSERTSECFVWVYCVSYPSIPFLVVSIAHQYVRDRV